MPGKKHLRGVGAKEQRQYEHIKQSAERSGRYGDRLKKLQPGPCSGSIKQEVTAGAVTPPRVGGAVVRQSRDQGVTAAPFAVTQVVVVRFVLAKKCLEYALQRF